MKQWREGKTGDKTERENKSEIIKSIDEMRSESRIVNLNAALITIMDEN